MSQSQEKGNRKIILITDLTKMWGDSVCVAGIDTKGNDIRPVLQNGPVTISHLYDKKGKLVVAPRHVVEFHFIEKIQNPPHTEDHVFDPSAVKFIRKTTEQKLKRALDKISYRSVENLFDKLLIDGKYCKPGTGKRSLGTVRARISGINLSDCRISFRDDAGKLYPNRKVNDLAFRRLAKYWNEPEESSKNTLAKRLKEKLKNVDQALLRLGLARPWINPNDGVEGCWLQVTGIYTFPDYLEGRTFADF